MKKVRDDVIKFCGRGVYRQVCIIEKQQQQQQQRKKKNKTRIFNYQPVWRSTQVLTSPTNVQRCCICHGVERGEKHASELLRLWKYYVVRNCKD